jgi:chaperonin GroEL
MQQQGNIGFNAKLGTWVDMIKEGIIDPTKVTRSAVLNASSIASIIITSEAAVVDIKDETTPNAPSMPPMY